MAPIQARRLSDPSLQPTSITPPLYRRGAVPYMVFGFLFAPEFADWYCNLHNIGPLGTSMERMNCYAFATNKVRIQAGVQNISAVKVVYTGLENPEVALCLMLGSNYSEQLRQQPREDVIRRVQGEMGVNMEPMWYRRNY